MEATEKKMPDISRFLDAQGRIRTMPSKRSLQLPVLAYLAEKFEPHRDYTEKEINTICDAWHTFGDFHRLRRDLVDHRFLARERDGSRYWRIVPDKTVDTGCKNPSEWEADPFRCLKRESLDTK